MMALRNELKQLTFVAYHATHLDQSNKLVPSGPPWTRVLSLLKSTVQEVIVTGNGIIWVVFLPPDAKIIAASIQLHTAAKTWNPTGLHIPCQICIPTVPFVRSGQRGVVTRGANRNPKILEFRIRTDNN